MLSPGTERAIVRLSDNIPRLIDALKGLSEAFLKMEPVLQSYKKYLDSTGMKSDEEKE